MIEPSEVLLLSARSPSTSLLLFLTRVLADCHLCVYIGSEDDVNASQVYSALQHFPRCRRISFYRLDGEPCAMSDNNLHALLHLPTAVSCSELMLGSFERVKTAGLPVLDEQKQAKARVRSSRSKRKGKKTCTISRMTPFTFEGVLLPALSGLRMPFSGGPCYIGFAPFLTAHTALKDIELSLVMVSIADLAAVLRDTAALPSLTRLELSDTASAHVSNCTPIVEALATTVMQATGVLRPLQNLTIDVGASKSLFSPVARLLQLTHISVTRIQPGWLSAWARKDEALTPLALVEQCVVRAKLICAHTGFDEPPDLHRFLSSVANPKLRVLLVNTGERVGVSAAAWAEIARCRELDSLELSNSVCCPHTWIDLRDASLYTSLSPGCLSALRNI